MIQEIAEEFNKQNRIMVLEFMNNIKDLDYEPNTRIKQTLTHRENNITIILKFNSFSKNIDDIFVVKNYGSYCEQTLVHITEGLKTIGVTNISKELYNKYFNKENSNE